MSTGGGPATRVAQLGLDAAAYPEGSPGLVRQNFSWICLHWGAASQAFGVPQGVEAVPPP